MILLASIVAGFLATSSAPTPLYAVYARQWHLTAGTTSLVFGVYALALLTALLTLGRLSDHLGWRPVVLAALAGQLLTVVVLADADGLPALMVGRVLQGVSTGLGIGAVAAVMMDIDRDAGTTANAIAPPLGSAIGALGAAMMVQSVAAPAQVIFFGFVVLLCAQGVMVLGVAEPSTRVPGALRSLRPWWRCLRTCASRCSPRRRSCSRSGRSRACTGRWARA